ncbi:MAG: NADH-quinone oxidoreductase subunit M [Proteobacteria bacterium]|nr:NADH-quinone oxidoreductase subunit M [Pseudomonadota bacterium]
MDNLPLLSIITFLPLAGAFALLLIPQEKVGLIKQTALGVACAGFAVSIPLLNYDGGRKGGIEFREKMDWVESLGITWHLGIDGISLWLVLLTTFLGPIVILGAWEAVHTRHREFFFHLLALQTFMLGTFVAQNLAVFYLFWELMLVPMFFLIGVFGGNERIYATVKFVLYTVFGSMLMLAAIFYLYWLHHEQFGTWSLEFIDLYKVQMGLSVQGWMLLAFGLAFAIKVPMFPLHTWLPDAHVQAPTAGSVVLAGVLLKMGTYGFLRLGMPLFPGAVEEWGWVVMLLAVIGIVYGALVAMVQPDMKKLVAYSSVSHMGYIMLGVFALNHQGVQGGILQMLNHGISTGALFLLVGVLYERTHTRNIWDYGGIAKVMPVYTTLFILVALSSAGLPGTNGFVGEFLTLLGAFRWGYAEAASGAGFWASYGFVVIACLGVILGAVYLLWMIERVFFGKILQERNLHLPDLTKREMAVFAPLVVMIFWLGLFPKPFIDKMEPSVETWIQNIDNGAAKTAELPPGLGSPGMPTLESVVVDAQEEAVR